MSPNQNSVLYLSFQNIIKDMIAQPPNRPVVATMTGTPPPLSFLQGKQPQAARYQSTCFLFGSSYRTDQLLIYHCPKNGPPQGLPFSWVCGFVRYTNMWRIREEGDTCLVIQISHINPSDQWGTDITAKSPSHPQPAFSIMPLPCSCSIT